MNPKGYFSITEKEALGKNHNIIIPICLGNKFFSDKTVINNNVEKYLQWALNNTKEKVLIVVVDKIQDTNYYVRNKKRTEEASLRRVLKDGQRIKTGIERIVEKYNNPDISVVVWQDYEDSDPYCKSITEVVYDFFSSNLIFRESVVDSVKNSLKDRNFNEEEYLKLAEYVLDEFCIVYSGATINKEYYGLYVYPDTDEVLFLIERIKEGVQFPDLRVRLPQKKVGLVILNS